MFCPAALSGPPFVMLVVAAMVLTLWPLRTAQAEPGDVVVGEDFSSEGLPAGWTPVLGDWQVADGRLVGDAVDRYSPSRLTFGPHLENYRFEATVRFEQVDTPSRWAGFLLDIQPSGDVPWWQAIIRTTTTASNGIEFAQRTADNRWIVPVTASAPYDAGTGRDIAMAVEVQSRSATWMFDGQVVAEGRISRSDDGGLGLSSPGPPSASMTSW